jgi:hypothetical protein
MVQASQSSIGSNEYPLNLVERDLLGAAVVEQRYAGRGMVRHLRGFFKRAAVVTPVARKVWLPTRVVMAPGIDLCRGVYGPFAYDRRRGDPTR